MSVKLLMPKLDGLDVLEDFIKGLPPKISLQLIRKILQLNKNPLPADSKLLAGYTNIYRIDSGEYRIAYEYRKNEDVIEIIIVRQNATTMMFYKRPEKIDGLNRAQFRAISVYDGGRGIIGGPLHRLSASHKGSATAASFRKTRYKK